MSNVTLNGFEGGETVNVYPFAVGELWTRQMSQTPPGAPVDTGAASEGGSVTFDLPDRQEFLALGVSSRTTKQVINAVTEGGSVPLVPAV